MDELDKIITDKWIALEKDAPIGHEKRFEERLNRSKKQKPERRWLYPLLKVASFILIILISANLYFNSFNVKDKKSYTVANQELNEAATFYNLRISNGINQLDNYAKQGVGNVEEMKQFKKEMSEMDLLFENLQKDYSSNPKDERVINAMISYYQTKLNIIQSIQSELENIKQMKSTQSKKTSNL